jgi:hypothetical protein
MAAVGALFRNGVFQALEITVFQNAGLDASQRQKCHLIRSLFILFSLQSYGQKQSWIHEKGIEHLEILYIWALTGFISSYYSTNGKAAQKEPRKPD